MSDISNLNLNVEEESQNVNNFDALPKGEYVAMITQSEMKENKSGQGEHISVTFQIIDGEFDGRMVWGNWNVKNANATAEKIGRAELAACCKAIGVANPQTTEDLHDKPMIIRLDLDRKDPTRNQIKGYAPADRPAEAAKPSEAAPKAAPAAATSTSAPKTAPWKSKK